MRSAGHDTQRSNVEFMAACGWGMPANPSMRRYVWSAFDMVFGYVHV